MPNIRLYLVRRALTDAPENIGTLIQSLSTRLFNLISDHTFPTLPTSGVSSIASSFIKTAATTTGVRAQSGQRDPTKEVLNCLRVLERVLPVFFESEYSEIETRILWHREEVDEGERSGRALDEQPQFVIEDEDDEDDAPKSPASPSSRTRTDSAKAAEKKTILPSLAEKLINSAIDLLFCCGFTLPRKIQVDHYKINYVIWYAWTFETLH